MRNTTLCYLEKDGKYLMLLRNKKKIDENKGKWIGVGGKFEEGESPDECLIREVREETGLELKKYQFRGIVTFVSDEWGVEYMHLYVGTEFTGTQKDCEEGELRWVPKSEVMNLNLWEGDRLFMPPLMNTSNLIFMKLVYHGDTLIEISEP